MVKRVSVIAVLCLVLIGCTLTCASAVPRYRVIPIGGPYSVHTAFDINNNNVVCLNYNSSGGLTPGTWTEQGGIVSLGMPNISASARGINDAGQVTGHFWDSNMAKYRAFLWSNGSYVDIGDLGASTTRYSTYGIDINNAGAIAGRGYYNRYNYAPFVWNGSISQISTPSVDMEPVGINDCGEVSLRKYVYKPGVGCIPLATTADKPIVQSQGINNNSQAFGQLGYIAGEGEDIYLVGQPAVWDANNSVTLLPLLPGSIEGDIADMNDNGLAIGHCGGVASVWDNGQVFALGSLLPADCGWSYLSLTAVNNNGWIVGTGQYQGSSYKFALAPVPEPSSLLVLGGGLISLVGFVRRRR